MTSLGEREREREREGGREREIIVFSISILHIYTYTHISDIYIMIHSRHTCYSDIRLDRFDPLMTRSIVFNQ